MTDDGYEYQEISAIYTVKSIIDECEKQTEQAPCECIKSRVKEFIDDAML